MAKNHMLYDPRYAKFYGNASFTVATSSRRLLFGEILIGSCFFVFFITITWGFLLICIFMIRYERRWAELRKLYAADVLNSIQVAPPSSRPPVKDKTPSISLGKSRQSSHGGKETVTIGGPKSSSILHAQPKVKAKCSPEPQHPERTTILHSQPKLQTTSSKEPRQPERTTILHSQPKLQTTSSQEPRQPQTLGMPERSTFLLAPQKSKPGRNQSSSEQRKPQIRGKPKRRSRQLAQQESASGSSSELRHQQRQGTLERVAETAFLQAQLESKLGSSTELRHKEHETTF